MQVQALLPLKDLVEAKSRLSGLLRPAERRSLAQSMVEDVLSILSRHPRIDAVTLVSDDPSAGMMAAKYSVHHWLEQSLECRGLNAVINRSCELLLGQSQQPIIVLHGDLPTLAAADISAVVEALEKNRGLIVGCDRHTLGTNLLAFGPDSKPKFSFGEDSCAQHCTWAESHGVPVQVLQRPGIALDIDEPRDLALLMKELEEGRQGHCARLLSGTVLGHRIAAQLASLEPGTPSPKERDDSEGIMTQ
jgi:2-phospho-L-lactate guanylyltransferase